jgi:hypothetical protein
MTEIIIAKHNPYDVDAPKECKDFVPLNDGTIAGDKKYCDRSRQCAQMGMYTEWHEWYEFFTGPDGKMCQEKYFDYLCTGKKPIWEERSKDEEAR